jgi:hypothetical protein
MIAALMTLFFSDRCGGGAPSGLRADIEIPKYDVANIPNVELALEVEHHRDVLGPIPLGRQRPDALE